MTSKTVDLLDVEGAGCGLRVSVSKKRMAGVQGDPWFDTAIAVVAPPFAGTVETTFTLSDLRDWATQLRRTEDLPRRVVLGGGRAAEVVIDIERQIGGADGALALEICATPSGDDPWPLIRFLVFGVSPFWEETASRIDRLG